MSLIILKRKIDELTARARAPLHRQGELKRRAAPLGIAQGHLAAVFNAL